MNVSEDRQYVIVCRRHKAILPQALLFWGSLTDDDMERSYGGYTMDIDKCERYTRNDLERLLLRDERPADKVVALACKALEKQIPKKPIKAKEHIMYSMCYICPNCQKNFSGTGIASYCYHCGQALDWSDEK